MLETTRVILRNSNESDLESIIEMEKEAAELGYVASWSVENHIEAQLNPLCNHMVIESKSGLTVGYLIGFTRPYDNYELMRIVVSKSGFAYGRSAIKLLMDKAFKGQINRFWLDVRKHNEKAIDLYLKMGFVSEGILRQAFKHNGHYVSVEVMSVLKETYEL